MQVLLRKVQVLLAASRQYSHGLRRGLVYRSCGAGLSEQHWD